MRLGDEQGMMAIGVALMLIVVLSLFGGVLWQYSMVEMKRIERTERDMQAMFLARAGAEAVMAAWLEESVANKPEGAMERIYYNTNTHLFQTGEPKEFLGYVDVVVTKINDPGNERDQLTEIVATAFVNQVSKTMKVTTFPHLLGHDDSLRWYAENTGRVQSVATTSDELVMIRTSNDVSLNFGQRTPPLGTGFTAPILLFTAPLDLSMNQTFSGRLFGDLGIDVQYKMPIRGEVIFFHDVVLANLPTRYNAYSLDFGVVLELPPGSSGTPGNEITGADATASYGKVYFDGDVAGIQNLMWTRSWLIFYNVEKNGAPIDLVSKNTTTTNKPLKGNAFYFRHGTDLSNIKDKDLIWIEPGGTRANELKEIRPFVWE